MSYSQKKSIGIVGGGLAGLLALAECNTYLDSVCPILYEQSSQIGGLWSQQSDLPGVLDTTVFNTSAGISSFESPTTLFEYIQKKYNGSQDYPTSNDFLAYLELWTNEINIRQFIQLNTCITKILGYNQSLGGCYVEGYVEKFNDGETTRECFNVKHDFLIICTGLNTRFVLPSWSQTNFPSESPPMHHTGQRESVDKISGKSNKNILVVGGGASAVEAVVELLKRGDSESLLYWLPTRHRDSRNVWIFDRYKTESTGRPNDEKICAVFSYFPSRLMSIIQGFVAYPLHKKSLLTYPGKNDIYGVGNVSILQEARENAKLQILTSDVVRINRTEENNDSVWAVDFENDFKLNVSKIVLATGYRHEVQFMSNSENLCQSLYKDVLGTRLEHWRCAFLGVKRVLGAAAPVLQMTARWTLHQWLKRKNCTEHDRSVLANKIKLNNGSNQFINPLIRCEELANDLGEKPSRFLRLFHPKREERLLGLVLLFGPWSCLHYSLHRDKERWRSYLIDQSKISFGIPNLHWLLFTWDSVLICLLSTFLYRFGKMYF